MKNESFLSTKQLDIVNRQLKYFNDNFFDREMLYTKHEHEYDAMDGAIAERIFVLKNDHEKVGDCFRLENEILKNNFYSMEKEALEIEMVLSSYRIYKTECLKSEYKRIYEFLIELTSAIQNPLYKKERINGLKMDFRINQRLELRVNIEINLNNKIRMINATCNSEKIFNDCYWRKIFYRLYKLENFLAFSDFNSMNFNEIEEHLALLSY